MESNVHEKRVRDLERRVQVLEQTVQELIWEKPFADDPDRKVNGMVKEMGEFISKTQAAELLGVTRATVYAMLADGRLKGGHSGSRVSTRSVGHYLFNPGLRKGKKNEGNA